MRRAVRLILDVAAVLSLVLAIGVAVLWVRGEFGRDEWWRTASFMADDGSGWQSRSTLDSSRGRVFATYGTEKSSNSTKSLPDGYHVSTSHYFGKTRRDASPSAFFFSWQTSSRGVGLIIALPHWAATLLFLALPSIKCWTFVRRRRRTRLAGHCPACGYDLRATPDRCPECGQITQTL